MTILLQRGGHLEGVSTALVKSAASTLWKVNRARLWDLAVALGAPEEQVKPLWVMLVNAHCIEKVGDDDWRPTHGMHSLATARIGPPLKRTKADALVLDIIRRAKEANASGGDEIAYFVTKIAVFGSYMTSDKDELGDLDIAWSLIERPKSAGWVSWMYSTGSDPQAHMRGLVRPKHAALRLIDMGSMKQLECPYRVVFEASGPEIEEAFSDQRRRFEEHQKSMDGLQDLFRSMAPSLKQGSGAA